MIDKVLADLMAHTIEADNGEFFLRRRVMVKMKDPLQWSAEEKLTYSRLYWRWRARIGCCFPNEVDD